MWFASQKVLDRSVRSPRTDQPRLHLIEVEPVSDQWKNVFVMKLRPDEVFADEALMAMHMSERFWGDRLERSTYSFGDCTAIHPQHFHRDLGHIVVLLLAVFDFHSSE